MEYGRIEREIHIDASPEIVFEVITRPEHLREWWPDEASLDDPTPGGTGMLTFQGGGHATPMTVIEAVPPRLFSFRWAYDPEVEPAPANSLLVTFELEPSRAGTRLRMTETGFREQGWEIAVLEATYQDHAQGWDHFIPQLGVYVAKLVSKP